MTRKNVSRQYISQELMKVFNILREYPGIVEESNVNSRLNGKIALVSSEEYMRKNIIYLAKQGINITEIADRFLMDTSSVKKIIKTNKTKE